jgi:hypothetical protein
VVDVDSSASADCRARLLARKYDAKILMSISQTHVVVANCCQRQPLFLLTSRVLSEMFHIDDSDKVGSADD